MQSTIHSKLLRGAVFMALALCFASPALAEEAVYGQPGDWLSSYNTARTAAMGGAYVANAGGALGPIWNPAGLSRMLQNQAHFETASLFGESRVTAFSFALPGKTLPSVGISIVSLSSGEFEQTNELNDVLGTFSEEDLAVYLTGSKAFSPMVSVGANLKLVRQSIEEFSGGGVGLDLGLMLNFGPHWRVGASALNLGGPTLTLRETDESYPAELRGGVSWRSLGGKASVSVEVDTRPGPGAVLRAGGEFWVHRSFALRAGYGDERVGAGMSFRIAHAFRIDYGAQDNELGMLHRFGLVYEFGGFSASSQAVPAVFSPTGENSITTFHLKAHTRGEPAQWKLTIIDKHQQIVRRFGGKGSPPAHVLWDGTDEAGMPLPDGRYSYSLIVLDAEDVEIDAQKREVEIFTQGPQGSVPVEVN